MLLNEWVEKLLLLLHSACCSQYRWAHWRFNNIISIVSTMLMFLISITMQCRLSIALRLWGDLKVLLHLCVCVSVVYHIGEAVLAFRPTVGHWKVSKAHMKTTCKIGLLHWLGDSAHCTILESQDQTKHAFQQQEKNFISCLICAIRYICFLGISGCLWSGNRSLVFCLLVAINLPRLDSLQPK